MVDLPHIQGIFFGNPDIRALYKSSQHLTPKSEATILDAWLIHGLRFRRPSRSPTESSAKCLGNDNVLAAGQVFSPTYSNCNTSIGCQTCTRCSLGDVSDDAVSF